MRYAMPIIGLSVNWWGSLSACALQQEIFYFLKLAAALAANSVIKKRATTGWSVGTCHNACHITNQSAYTAMSALVDGRDAGFEGRGGLLT